MTNDYVSGKKNHIIDPSTDQLMNTYMQRLTSHEIMLLDFFRRKVSWPISRGHKEAFNVWRYDAINYGIMHSDPVLHALLAVSEYEYSANVFGRSKATSRAAAYLKRAIMEHRREVSQPMSLTKATPESLVLTSALLGVYMQLSDFEIPIISSSQKQLDFLGIVRGVNSLYCYFSLKNVIQTSFLFHLLLDPRLLRNTPSMEFEFITKLLTEVSSELKIGRISSKEAKCYVDALTDFSYLFTMATKHRQLVAVPLAIISLTDSFTTYARQGRPLARLIFTYIATPYVQMLQGGDLGSSRRPDIWKSFFKESWVVLPPRYHHHLTKIELVLDRRAPPFVPLQFMQITEIGEGPEEVLDNALPAQPLKKEVMNQ